MRSSGVVARVVVPGLIGALASGAAVVATAGAAPAQAPELVAFDASSSAMGLQVELEVPGAPISSNLFDGGGPLAQAGIDGLGTSQAYASLPYPGDTANTLPNLLLPIVGLPGLPPYPLQASSQAGLQESQDAEYGAIALHAESDTQASEARGSAGGGSSGTVTVGNVEASASAAADEGTLDVTAEGASTVQSLSVAGVLNVGSATATATAVRHADGTSETSSTFEVDGVTIAGLHVGMTGDGLVLPGTSAPVPSTDGLSPILDPAGITVEVLPEEPFEGGVRSRGLAITIPAPGTLARGRVTITLGRATATSASTVRLVEPPAGRIDPGTGAPLPPTALPSGGSSSSLPASPVAPTPVAPGRPAATATPVASASAGTIDTIETASFYLVLIAGAVTAIASSFFLRKFGVKLAWTG